MVSAHFFNACHTNDRLYTCLTVILDDENFVRTQASFQNAHSGKISHLRNSERK